MSGKLFIISAPSGAGKTTLVNAVLKEIDSNGTLERIVTYTTKQPRVGECPGTDYHYLSTAEFERNIKKGFFVEWSNAYGAYYGSPCSMITDVHHGKSFVAILDRVGMQQVIQKIDAVTVWVYTKNIEILRKRLKQRNTETEQQIYKRLQRAQQEIQWEKENRLYKYHVLNDNFTNACNALKDIIITELNR